MEGRHGRRTLAQVSIRARVVPIPMSKSDRRDHADEKQAGEFAMTNDVSLSHREHLAGFRVWP